MASGARVSFHDFLELGIELDHAEIVDDSGHEVSAVFVDHVIHACRLAFGVQQTNE